MIPPKSSTRRVAIVSDTHSVISPDILNAIKSCDQIIHAGDICGAHILDQLKAICPNVTAVTGNNDVASLWAENEKSVVNSLPAIAEIDLPGGIVAIEHGHKHGMHQPDHTSLRMSHPHAKVIVYGHTHTMLVDDETNPWVINPGAAGATRTRGGPSCLILTASEDCDWNIEMIRFEEEAVA
ncbi:MAG: YfcE family phosphodiesterase [endosymbiont of Galathealinum brachiosum]|uniref:Phosphoesterase n=1 Tax=endosymbiont of Galathealinum brachiosum TaxID=2200906 RepID=A0A370D895_9GAMM|nr:MAG: YfcE family phosphodiesterase [endosymbiont of Galathealinum brachiosum]